MENSQASAIASAQRPGVTIQHKLVGLMLLMTVSIVGLLTLYFPAQQIDALEESLEQQSRTYAELVAQQVRSAVAFDDRATARETFDALAHDPLVTSIILFTQDGHTLHSYGTPSKAAMAAKGGVSQLLHFRLADHVLAVAPVVSAEGPIGTVALELSSKQLKARADKVQQFAALLGLGAVLLGLAAAWLIARSFSRRIRLIADAACRVAEGQLHQKPIADRQVDEIAVLARAFNAMVSQLQLQFRHLESNARNEQNRLEAIVHERTQALENHSRGMRIVLDTINRGYLTIDRRGAMSTERSISLSRWLGTPPNPDATLWDYIAQVAPEQQLDFEVAWQEVVAGVLPLEMTLEQMPAQFTANGRYYGLSYAPLGATKDDFEPLLVIFTDITDELQLARVETNNQEIARVFAHVIRDRRGFLAFLSDAQYNIDFLAEGTAPLHDLYGAVRTLKASAEVFRLESVVATCEHMEVHLDEFQRAPTELAVQLKQRWSDFSDGISQITHCHIQTTGVDLGSAEFLEILAAIRAGQPRSQVHAMLDAWGLEPTVVRLDRLSQHIHALAKRLGKEPVEVVIEHHRLRTDGDRFAPLWSELLHVVSNAVDHGLETPEERARLSKAGPARITLRTKVAGEHFVIEVEDNGRGIPWTKVRDGAQRQGLPHQSHKDLVNALFADGLSTKTDISELSGHGLGLGSARAACEALGGQVAVGSQLGIYTRISFSWPLTDAATAHAPLTTPAPISLSIGLNHCATLQSPAAEQAQHIARKAG